MGYARSKGTGVHGVKRKTNSVDAHEGVHNGRSSLEKKKLKRLHTQIGPVRKVQLYQRLLRFNMQQDENVGAHVNSFVETIERLAELDIKINEE